MIKPLYAEMTVNRNQSCKSIIFAISVALSFLFASLAMPTAARAEDAGAALLKVFGLTPDLSKAECEKDICYLENKALGFASATGVFGKSPGAVVLVKKPTKFEFFDILSLVTGAKVSDVMVSTMVLPRVISDLDLPKGLMHDTVKEQYYGNLNTDLGVQLQGRFQLDKKSILGVTFASLGLPNDVLLRAGISPSIFPGAWSKASPKIEATLSSFIEMRMKKWDNPLNMTGMTLSDATIYVSSSQQAPGFFNGTPKQYGMNVAIEGYLSLSGSDDRHFFTAAVPLPNDGIGPTDAMSIKVGLATKKISLGDVLKFGVAMNTMAYPSSVMPKELNDIQEAMLNMANLPDIVSIVHPDQKAFDKVKDNFFTDNSVAAKAEKAKDDAPERWNGPSADQFNILFLSGPLVSHRTNIKTDDKWSVQTVSGPFFQVLGAVEFAGHKFVEADVKFNANPLNGPVEARAKGAVSANVNIGKISGTDLGSVGFDARFDVKPDNYFMTGNLNLGSTLGRARFFELKVSDAAKVEFYSKADCLLPVDLKTVTNLSKPENLFEETLKNLQEIKPRPEVLGDCFMTGLYIVGDLAKDAGKAIEKGAEQVGKQISRTANRALCSMFGANCKKKKKPPMPGNAFSWARLGTDNGGRDFAVSRDLGPGQVFEHWSVNEWGHLYLRSSSNSGEISGTREKVQLRKQKYKNAKGEFTQLWNSEKIAVGKNNSLFLINRDNNGTLNWSTGREFRKGEVEFFNLTKRVKGITSGVKDVDANAGVVHVLDANKQVLSSVDGGTMESLSFNIVSGPKNVTSIATDFKGRLWVVEDGWRIRKFDDQLNEMVDVSLLVDEEIAKTTPITQLTVDKYDRPWVALGGANYNLYAMTSSGWELYQGKVSLIGAGKGVFYAAPIENSNSYFMRAFIPEFIEAGPVADWRFSFTPYYEEDVCFQTSTPSQGRTKNHHPIILATCLNTYLKEVPSQQFYMQRVDGMEAGYGRIVSVETKLCLGTLFDAEDEGVAATLMPCDQKALVQHWKISRWDDGDGISLVAGGSGLCLNLSKDVKEQEATSGLPNFPPMTMEKCDDKSENQRFDIDSITKEKLASNNSSEPAVFKLPPDKWERQFVSKDGGYCIDVNERNSYPWQYGCFTNLAHQRIFLEPHPENLGEYRLNARVKKECLQSAASSSNNPSVLDKLSGLDNLLPKGKSIIATDDKNDDPKVSIITNGIGKQVTTAKCNFEAAQIWGMEPADDNKTWFRIKNKLGGCLGSGKNQSKGRYYLEKCGPSNTSPNDDQLFRFMNVYVQ